MLKKILVILLVVGLFVSGCLRPVERKEFLISTIFSESRPVGTSPKNVIILISDGCGYNQIDAASLYQYGETGVQVYESFPVKLGMTTFPAGGGYDPVKAWESFGYFKDGATDSAASGTAISCGLKTYNGAIGVDVDRVPVINIMEKAEVFGMSTGVVTSVMFSHATPAAFVAHNVSRGNYEKIANEMIYESGCDVIMGCGAPDYDNNGKQASKNKKCVGGAETWDDIMDDGLVTGADADGDGDTDVWTVIRAREDFQAMASGDTPSRVLGIPMVYQTLQQSRSGDKKAGPYVVGMKDTIVTLEEMTRAALNVLDNDADGFVLMVEGGAVDWAGHENQSGRIIEEQIEFNKAVEAVVGWVEKNSNWGETLVIVTGDHETGYITGPDSGGNLNGPVWNELVNNGKGNLPGMEWHSGGHTNQVIPFFAKGKGAELFKDRIDSTDKVRGDYIDNTDIANVIFELLE